MQYSDADPDAAPLANYDPPADAPKRDWPTGALIRRSCRVRRRRERGEASVADLQEHTVVLHELRSRGFEAVPDAAELASLEAAGRLDATPDAGAAAGDDGTDAGTGGDAREDGDDAGGGDPTGGGSTPAD